jgi:hypothetical protein
MTSQRSYSGDAAISMRDEVEEFAQGFDGCMVDGVGGEIDVGEAIRTWARQRDALARLGTPATALTHAARAQSRIDQFIFKWICSEYEFNTDDFKQAKRDFLEAAYAEGRADQTEEAQSVLDIIDEAQCDPGRSVEYRTGYFDAYKEIRAALSSSPSPAREEAGEDASSASGEGSNS